MLSFRFRVILGLTFVVALAVVRPCLDLKGLSVSKLVKLLKLLALDSLPCFAFFDTGLVNGDDSKLSKLLVDFVPFPFLDLEERFEVFVLDLAFFLLEWVGVFAISRGCSSSVSINSSGAGL